MKIKFIDKSYSFEKKILSVLCENFGLGLRSSLLLCSRYSLNPWVKLKKIPVYVLKRLELDLMLFKFGLNKFLERNYKDVFLFLAKAGCYKHKRRILRLPMRGQHTKTNARTVKKGIGLFF